MTEPEALLFALRFLRRYRETVGPAWGDEPPYFAATNALTFQVAALTGRPIKDIAAELEVVES